MGAGYCTECGECYEDPQDEIYGEELQELNEAWCRWEYGDRHYVPAIAFISGHLDLTADEFRQHYVPLIDQAIEQQHRFVVGDARGADNMAQLYLKLRGVQATVFHAYARPRNNLGFPSNGGHRSQTAKDAAMTAASTYDIAWVRPGKEASGTAKNLERRGRAGAPR